MKFGHIGGTQAHPLRGPRPLPPPDDCAEDQAVLPDEPDGVEPFGSVISLPLWKSRDDLLRTWDGIGDQATVDRGWGAIPSLPSDAMIEERYLTAAFETSLGLDAVVAMAKKGRWAAYTGVDTASSTKPDADFTAMMTLVCDPESARWYVAHLVYQRGLTLPRQLRHLREIDDVFSSTFRIEGVAAAAGTAEYLATQVRHGESFATTQKSKREAQQALVAAFQAGRIVIPWNAQARRLLDGLVRELRVFPRGRHDDAVDALSFAIIAALRDDDNLKKKRTGRVSVEWIKLR